MDTFNLLFIAPLWAIVSTQLLFEAVIEFVNIFIHLAGIFRRRVSVKYSIEEMALSFGSVVLYLILIGAGLWLLSEKIPFHWTEANKLMYGVFCVFSSLYAISRMPTKWSQTWREATEPNTLQQRRSHLEHEKEV
ncbi:MAG TPA: hypothetical protein VFR09_05375 [Alphaproteobacteria bacterium]|nr:hypothetical protein [Alphaproteobacteria bacterium]